MPHRPSKHTDLFAVEKSAEIGAAGLSEIRHPVLERGKCKTERIRQLRDRALLRLREGEQSGRLRDLVA